MTNQNIYAPPAATDQEWQQPLPAGPPPGSPKVFGILSIIFGSLIALGGLLGSCMGLVGQNLGRMGSGLTNNPNVGSAEAKMVETMFEHLGTIYGAMGIQSVIFAAMSGWLIAIGVGQLRYRRWAQKQTVVWSTLALVVLGGVTLIWFFMIGPAYEAMFEAISKQAPSGALPIKPENISWFAGGWAMLFNLLFYAPYPVLMLGFFTRPRVKGAMVN